MKMWGETKLLLTRPIKDHKKLAQRSGKFHAPIKLRNAKRILQDKTYNFVHSLLVSSVTVKITCFLKKPSTSTRPANIPKNIAQLPMPAPEELIKKREQQEQKQMESMKRVLEKKESSKQKEEGLTKV